MMKLTLNEINIILDSFIDKREIQLNDNLYVMHNAASLISLAVWGSKDFPKNTPRLRLRPMTEEEYNQKLEDDTRAYLEMMAPIIEAARREGKVSG